MPSCVVLALLSAVVVVAVVVASGGGTLDGFGTNAQFRQPHGIALSTDENHLYVADTNHYRIRDVKLTTITVGNLARAPLDGRGPSANMMNELDGQYGGRSEGVRRRRLQVSASALPPPDPPPSPKPSAPPPPPGRGTRNDTQELMNHTHAGR